MSCIKDIVEVVGGIVTILATILGLLGAYYGFSSWQRETTGRRRIELAEESVLLAFEIKRFIHKLATFAIAAGPMKAELYQKNFSDEALRLEDGLVAKEMLFLVYFSEHERLIRLLRANLANITAIASASGSTSQNEIKQLEEIRKSTDLTVEDVRTACAGLIPKS